MSVKLKNISPYLFFLPAFILLVLLFLYPLMNSIILCFMAYDLTRPALGKEFVGLHNFIRAINDNIFLTSIKNTLIYGASTLSLELGIAIPLAILIFRKKKGGGRILRTIFLIPLMVAYVVTGLMWRFMFLRVGLFNTLLSKIGINGPTWLSNPSMVMPAIVIMSLWKNLPFVFLIVVGGLYSFPIEPFEAAVMDGASGWQLFRYITLPLLKPIVGVILMLRTADIIKIFDEVYTMTGGGPGYCSETMCLYAYETGFSTWRMGYAATISWFMLFFTVGFSYVYYKLLYEE